VVANPVSPAFSVSEGGISTQTFIIDQLSDIEITTLSDITEGSQVYLFTATSGIATSTDTTVDGGDLVLADTAGAYEVTGTTFLTPVVPATLVAWETIRIGAELDSGTDYIVQLFTGNAVDGYTLIPETDLPGNAMGFADSLVDISSLDIGSYPTTTVGITLTTADPSTTPEIEEVAVYWRESATARAGQPLFVRGDKLLGTDSVGGSIYKSTSTVTTDGSGEVLLESMEFDTYTATTTSAFNLASACPAMPLLHRGGVESEVELLYVPAAAQSVRVVVTDTLGRPVPGAQVQLQRAGYDVTQSTNTCGQTFFTGAVAAEADYDLTVSAPGYSTQTLTPFEVSGNMTTQIVLSP
jgi:hypothetical protein